MLSAGDDCPLILMCMAYLEGVKAKEYTKRLWQKNATRANIMDRPIMF
jgi:hypothetical protein